MACAAPSFHLLLEDGAAVLQEDGTSEFLLELATTTGLFVCGATIPSTTQLFPPAVALVTPPSSTKVCDAQPTFVAVTASVCQPAAAVWPQLLSRALAPTADTPQVVSVVAPPPEAAAAPRVVCRVVAAPSPASPTDPVTPCTGGRLL